MNIAVIGASGYAGAELVGMLAKHELVTGLHLLVSENSESKGQLFSALYPKYQGMCDLPLQGFNQAWLDEHGQQLDVVFMATPHEYSQQWASEFIKHNVKVLDLSGAFRLDSVDDYPKYYGFTHKEAALLENAVYGLVEWHEEQIKQASIVAVPGCYPTASLLSIKPVTANGLLADNSLIVVNGISGVSGAGRKAALGTSFNEVSLTAYNILQHRHQPEIAQQSQLDSGQQVIFNPHLAPYKRGLLCTVTMQLKPGVSSEQVDQAFINAYQETPMVRLMQSWPKIDDVAGTPFANLHYKFDAQSQVLVVSCAIDNLLKGAASQAMQCFNLIHNKANYFALHQGGF